MELLNASLASAMALIAGAMVVLALTRYPLRAAPAGFAMGLGYLLGIALAGLGVWLGAALGLEQPTLAAATVLTLTTGVAGAFYLRGPRHPLPPAAGVPRAGVAWATWGLLLTLLAVNAALLIAEAQARPVYGWDAWSAWLVKAKVWAHLGPGVEFVGLNQWLAAPPGSVYTNAAWHYPELLPHVQLWTVGWVGGWDERLALLPWGLLYPALLVATYCGLRLLGTAALAAMVVTYLVGAIPILGIQIALAGYADVWVAAELTLFAVCGLMFLERGQRGMLVAALGLLAMAAATKLEGLVWALLGLAVLGLSVLSARNRRRVLIGVGALAALWLLAGGIDVTLPGGRQVVITPERIELPYLGGFALSFSNRLDAFARAFLVLPNWHFVWYLLLPCGLWLAFTARRERAGQGLAAYLVLGLAFLFGLFFLTPAGLWAESMTASNRVALQFAPGAVVWIGYLLGRAAASATTSA